MQNEPNRLTKQIEYTKKHNLPMFAPIDGVCWSCNRVIHDTDDYLITGCEYCNRSYDD